MSKQLTESLVMNNETKNQIKHFDVTKPLAMRNGKWKVEYLTTDSNSCHWFKFTSIETNKSVVEKRFKNGGFFANSEITSGCDVINLRKKVKIDFWMNVYLDTQLRG